MSKLNLSGDQRVAMLRLFGICFAGFAMGAVFLFSIYIALSSGELRIPKKFSSGPASIVTPSQLPAVYYGFLTLFAMAGFASITAAFMIAWRFWCATPDKRERMLIVHMPSTSKRPARIFRTLLLFIAFPLLAIFIIMFATILKSS